MPTAQTSLGCSALFCLKLFTRLDSSTDSDTFCSKELGAQTLRVDGSGRLSCYWVDFLVTLVLVLSVPLIFWISHDMAFDGSELLWIFNMTLIR
ncbi:hypothetical protein A2U01_0026957, partial [Trifolium medium]|nr:hypothetical protein [Trifolium medium]